MKINRNKNMNENPQDNIPPNIMYVYDPKGIVPLIQTNPIDPKKNLLKQFYLSDGELYIETQCPDLHEGIVFIVGENIYAHLRQLIYKKELWEKEMEKTWIRIG
jgi:hypothetical protein